jgi:hypothetical protein
VGHIAVYLDGRSLDALIDLWTEEGGSSGLMLQVYVSGNVRSVLLVTSYRSTFPKTEWLGRSASGPSCVKTQKVEIFMGRMIPPDIKKIA